MLEAVSIHNDPNFSQFAAGIRSFELRRPGSTRELEIRSVNRELVGDELQTLLTEFGRGSQIFPLNFWMYEGRSLYALFSETARAHFKLDGINRKGAGGLVGGEDGTKSLEVAKAMERFIWCKEPHLEVDPYPMGVCQPGGRKPPSRRSMLPDTPHRLRSKKFLLICRHSTREFRYG